MDVCLTATAHQAPSTLQVVGDSGHAVVKRGGRQESGHASGAHQCGILLADPTDLTAFARAVGQLLDDPELADRIGRAAHERAAEFLPDLHLKRWANLLAGLTDPGRDL